MPDSLPSEMANAKTILNFYYKDANSLQSRLNVWEKYGQNSQALSSFIIEKTKERTDQISPWLDVGCGTGALIQDLMKHTEAAEIFGVDLATAMIEETKKKNGNNKRIKLQVADAMDLPFEKNFFSVVTALHVLHHIGNRERFFTELIRVTQSHGMVVLTSPQQALDDGFNQLHYATIKQLNFPAAMQILPQTYPSISTMTSELSVFFSRNEVITYENKLVFTQVQPALEYYGSAMMYRGSQGPSDPYISPEMWLQLLDRMKTLIGIQIEEKGQFTVPGQVNVYICQKK